MSHNIYTRSLVALVLLCAFPVHADYFSNNNSPAPLSNLDGSFCSSPDGCAATLKAACDAAFGPCGPYSLSNVGPGPTIYIQGNRGGGGLYVGTATWSAGCGAGEVEGVDSNGWPTCEVVPQCDGTVTGQSFLRPVFSGDSQGNICHESSGCVMTATNIQQMNGSQDALIEYEGTAGSCTSEPDVPIGPEAADTNCISSGGDTWCTEPDLADENCGTLNGDYVCLGEIPDGACTFYGNGDMACASNAASPPAPDDGVTPGNVATPDATIDVNGQTTNIYNGITVGGSTASTTGSEQGTDPGETPTIELDFSEIIEPTGDPGTYDDSVESDIAGTAADLDEVVSELGDANDFGQSSSAGATWTSIFGISYACTDIVLTTPAYNVTLACSELEDARSVLGWIARVLFFVAVFNLIMRPPE